jgi:hypothetical protein
MGTGRAMSEDISSPANCPFQKIHPSQLEKDDLFYMKLAYNQAIDAWNHGEVPIGAVIPCVDGLIVSQLHVEKIVLLQLRRMDFLKGAVGWA